MTSPDILSNTNYSVIGTRPIRHDGYDKVTGKALYGADISLPGMLHGKILRSPHAHARIRAIDTSKAEALPSVKAVLTSADMVEFSNKAVEQASAPPVNHNYKGSNIMARTKVLYKGHALAAVAADSPHAAEEALALIDVDYEVLSAASDVESAMSPRAERLHDEIEGNIASHNQTMLGDSEKGFKSADLVFEREYRSKTVHQGYIEPHAATVWWTPNDKITIWSSSQGHFPVRSMTAELVGVKPFNIKVVPMEIGGGFGGKTTIYLEPIAAVLSKKTGQPVKMTMSRAEVIEATGPAPGSYMKVKMGVTNEGKITASQADLRFEAGAYPGSPVGAAAVCIFAPYNIENLSIDAYDVVTNKPKTTAYRAPGAPLGAFAIESLIDEICEKLHIDPLEFRILNGAKEGTRRSYGMVNPRIGAIETAQAAKDHQHYSTPLEGPNRGRGVASGFWINGSGHACATAMVNFDGTVNLTIGSMDIGGLRPVAAQHLAEVLGIPVQDVNPQVGDTDSIGFTSMTGGSGAAFKTGWASYEAANDVKRQMIDRAAMIWETPREEIDLVDGIFRHKSDPELSINFKELATETQVTGGPVVGRANMDPKGPGSAFATHIVDLEVDPETGKVTILRYTAVQDVGKAIHPSYVEGQIQGGVVQGIGWALNEEYFMGAEGQVLNTSLLDYRMPTTLDLPMVDTMIVEVANPNHPFGVRGVGEVPIVPPLAAVANAVYQATGVRMRSLPINPLSVSKALSEK
ncbi:xanthine dehydrogenase family protein molybdopterin-binding subunit [Dehalococcoidia bacterium]|nr:xanthine dehydrogenase family protein molybdopterin-binding subunit [Dehalococcoidia bacterium]